MPHFTQSFLGASVIQAAQSDQVAQPVPVAAVMGMAQTPVETYRGARIYGGFTVPGMNKVTYKAIAEARNAIAKQLADQERWANQPKYRGVLIYETQSQQPDGTYKKHGGWEGQYGDHFFAAPTLPQLKAQIDAFLNPPAQSILPGIKWGSLIKKC